MSVTATGSPFYVQIGGVWLRLDAATPVVQIKTDRGGSSWASLGNVVRTQVAPRSNREWSIGFAGETAEAARWLALAAQGLIGDVFLYDAAAAQSNMLADHDTIGRDAAQPTILVETVPLRTFAASYMLTMKLRAGVTYHLSYVTSHTAAATIGTYNLGAGAVNIVAPGGSGARPGSASFTPAADATVTIIVTVAGKTSGLRLTEGSVDTIGFLPGQKAVCQVQVGDPQQTLNQFFTDALPLSDYSVLLREVGK